MMRHGGDAQIEHFAQSVHIAFALAEKFQEFQAVRLPEGGEDARDLLVYDVLEL
jgi:hypothetical protein